MKASWEIVRGIITDLKDRRGLSNAWDDIDDDIQLEIARVWMGIVEDGIGTLDVMG